MSYKLIHNFLNKHFLEIESVILFGSYIDNPNKANDIDLLLLSNKFFYSSKESFFFENKKINIIKFNISEVFSILAKHYQQGDFYRLVFSKGIVLVDKNKDLQFVRQYINNSYPNGDKDILASALTETVFKLTEYQDALKKSLSEIEYFTLTSKIVFHLMDWFLLSNGLHNLKVDNKYKSGFFNKHFPLENDKLLKLITSIKKSNPKNFLLVLDSITKEHNILNKSKYSNDLIFDDYSQPNLTLYIEKLFNFNEIKEIISKIKSKNSKLQFYIYQVDEDNQEKTGCYIVFDNSNLQFENNKLEWIKYFQNLFSKLQYTFPYNNIFCYPEIKFIGKQNKQLVNQLLTNCTNAIGANLFSKEVFLLTFINTYISKSEVKIDDVYNYYLGKLNAKTRTSNYLTQKQKITEDKFLTANATNKKIAMQVLEKAKISNLNIEFPMFTEVPVWFHFQVIDLLISTLIKNDFEKLFYINCIKKINE
jgi:hypothetical protein